MVIIYNFSTHILQRWQTHAPHLLENLMAMGMHQYGTEHIDQCAMLSASIEATRRRNWLIICCVSPRWLPGSQTNKHTTKQTPPLLAIFDGHDMSWYDIKHIVWCSTSRASIEAIEHCYQVSVCCPWSCHTTPNCKFLKKGVAARD